MQEAQEERQMHIYANPGWVWILWIPIMGANIPFMMRVGFTHPGVLFFLTIFFLSLVGTSIWMVHVPHISATAKSITIRYVFGQSEVAFDDIARWGSSLGSFYIIRADGRKIWAAMFLYVDRADRERVFNALEHKGPQGTRD